MAPTTREQKEAVLPLTLEKNPVFNFKKTQKNLDFILSF